MPWTLDAQTSFGKVEFDAEPVTYKDEELFTLTSQRQFPDTRSQMQLEFKRAEFELGRRYWRILNVKQPDRQVPEQIKLHMLTPDGELPDWFKSNLDVPDGNLPSRLGESNVICNRFKSLLEEMEPGRHLFVERDFRMPDHVTPWPVKYWKWLCCNYVDAIVPDIGNEDARRSTGYFWMMDRGMFARRNFSDGQPLFSPLLNPPTVDGHNYIPVLNDAAILGMHAWCDAAFSSATSRSTIFLSDELVCRMKEEDILSGFFLREISISNLPATRDTGEGIYNG